MRNLKRVLSLALALVMVLGMMVIGTSAATYADAADIDYTEAVDVMSALKVLEGDGTNYNPDAILTRAEATTIIARMLLGKETAGKLTGSGVYTDTVGHWAAGYIDYCDSLDILAGNGDGTFDPNGKLTGIAFAKMLLVALGYDPAIEGYVNNKNWATNISTDAISVGLEVKGVALADEVSREVAAQMALQALEKTMVEYATKGTSITINGVEIVSGASAAEAKTWADYPNKTPVDYKAGSQTNSTDTVEFSELYFKDLDKLTSGADARDAFGRPGYTWKWGNKPTEKTFVVKTPVLTYENTTMAEKDLAAALGAVAGRNVTIEAIYEDGIAWTGTSTHANAVVGGGKMLNPGATMTLENGTDYKHNVPGFGKGIKVELYKTDMVKNEYTMVCIREYLGTVAGVNPADAANGVMRSVDIYVPGVSTSEFKTESFAMGQTVLVTVADGQVKTAVAPAVISGTVTKITNNSVYTIGGTDYVMSQLSTASTPTLSPVPGEWYVDSWNNIIGNKTGVTLTAWNYGYLVDYAYSHKTTALIGAATENAEKFQIITAEGQKVTLDGAFTTDAVTGVVTDWQWDDNGHVYSSGSLTGSAYDISTNDYLVRYTLNADGKINEIEEVTNGTTGVTSMGTTNPVVKGDAILANTSDYVTDTTKFIVYANDNSFAVYTGYKNIPASTTITGGDYFFAEKIDPSTGNVVADDTKVAAVVLKVASASTQSSANLVWFAGADKYSETTTAGTVTTYTNVYLNGVKGEIKFLGTDPVAQAVAGRLYQYTVNTTTGYATLGTNMGVLTLDSGFSTTATISRIESGYYVTDHSSYPTIYINEATQYFQVDPITKVVTKVASLPAVNVNAYYIEQIMADGANGANPVTSTEPATIVYFSVVAK